MTEKTSTTVLAQKFGIALIMLLITIYVIAVIWRVVALVQIADPIAWLFALGLTVTAGIGVWAVIIELPFAFRAAELSRRLEVAGRDVSDLGLVANASGRPDRGSAIAVMDRLNSEVDADPQDWMVWHRRGIVRRAAGDGRGARADVRQAIKLAKAKSS
ncbi:tetratricopeptide repeat protein [Canibacter zhoujuaniae]|uniref:tetratricopeptide repeat protein n=1 Tax=Canibacter zhoujuaniae TaxID=2708343 RepID=UPI0014215C6E|nr:hypothetical protein [Canibacter zhoujuaniae]